MKTKIPKLLMSFLIVPVNQETASDSSVSYVIGGIIALLILGYLIYTLLWPEKF